MEKSLVEQYVENPAHSRLFLQEKAIFEITELLEAVLQEENVTRSELAARLGKTKGWITQLLDGEANKTIRTIADVLAVLGRELGFSAPHARMNDKSSFRVKVPLAWPKNESASEWKLPPNRAGSDTQITA